MDVIISPNFFMSVYFASFVNTHKSSYRLLAKKLAVVNWSAAILNFYVIVSSLQLFCECLSTFYTRWNLQAGLQKYYIELLIEVTWSSSIDWSPPHPSQVLTLDSSTLDGSNRCFGLPDTGLRGLQRNMTMGRKG